MKNKLFIRKDIQFSMNTLTKALVKVGYFISEYKADGSIDILETMYLKELENLEAIFIREGMHFQWIEGEKETIGILAIAIEDFIDPDFTLSYKDYTPDENLDNLRQVNEEYLNKMKELSKSNN